MIIYRQFQLGFLMVLDFLYFYLKVLFVIWDFIKIQVQNFGVRGLFLLLTFSFEFD